MFSKPNAIIYLRRNGLVLAGKRLTPARLSFAPEVVNNLEVLRANTLTKACQTFFEKHELQGKRVLMVLDDSLIFYKEVELDQASHPADIVKAYVNTMPFNRGQRACLQLRNQNQLRLLATNAELYTAIAQAISSVSGAKLIAITPAIAYDLDEEHQQLASAIGEFINDTVVRSKVDFSATAPL